MKRIIKNSLVALGGLALLAGDAWVTWRLVTRQELRAASAPAHIEAEPDPIARFRLEREQLRARQEAQLNDIIYSDRSDAETVAQAQRQLLELLSCARSEQTLEGILQSRGFEDTLVSVSEASANVLLKQESVSQRETSVILELVMRETGLTGGNVKIIPVK